MFTGLVETLGYIEKTQKTSEGDLILTINAKGLGLDNAEIGDSIAVNGACLTAVTLTGDNFDADVSKESLAHTRLEQLKSGDTVNLEKALTLSKPLGGHLVSGHVDGVGQVKALARDARSVRIEIDSPHELSRYIANKGSICVDGVSLTVTKVEGSSFHLNIVPHTADRTIIKDYQPGTQVHLEVDLLARYLERLLQQGGHESKSSNVTMDLLAKNGFLNK